MAERFDGVEKSELLGPGESRDETRIRCDGKGHVYRTGGGVGGDKIERFNLSSAGSSPDRAKVCFLLLAGFDFCCFCGLSSGWDGALFSTVARICDSGWGGCCTSYI